MRISFGNIINNERSSLEVQGNRVRIGRKPDLELVLAHPSIAPEAALLHVHNGAWELVCLGTNLIDAGERKLRRGERIAVKNGMLIQIWPFSLSVDLPATEASPLDDRQLLDVRLSELIGQIHLELLHRLDLASRGSVQREDSDDYHLAMERNVEDVARQLRMLETEQADIVEHTAALCARRQLTEALLTSDKSPWQTEERRSRLFSSVPEREQELKGLVGRLAVQTGAAALADLSDKIRRIDSHFWPTWQESSTQLFVDFKHYLVNRYLKKELKDIVFGYGPLEDLLRNPTINEIMVVDRERIFIEKSGVLENSGRRFISDEITEAIIQRIVARVGRRIDKTSPLVDARLADGSRVNAVISPIAVSGPCLTIRKFPSRKLGLDDLVQKNSLSRSAAEFLKASVLARKNILVSGGTGSGKTTLLNCFSDFIPDKERIVTIEDTAELQLKKPHVVRLETKAANVEGAGAYTIRDLVKNALRMRPDRIVVGECRGPEALDMLQAMNSGHDGSMTTLHANSSADAVLRLEVLVQMAADLPVSSIHRQIASAVDVVVQLQRLRSGRRCITQITEYVGHDADRGGVKMRDLFLLDDNDDKAELAPTGCLPTFIDELLSSGALNLETFYQ